MAHPTLTHSPLPVLTIDHLSIGFPSAAGMALAVHELSLELHEKEILGLVGESGCGKSLTALACLNLIPPPGRITQGHIQLLNESFLTLPAQEQRKRRGTRIAYIPQDPMSSLNPVYTIGEQIAEVLMAHRGISALEAKKQAIQALEAVRIPSAASRYSQYPHEFSGGMRQRVMIAMALCCSPQVLIADEPTTALDVTVQAQILQLLLSLRDELGMAIVLITHDLGVVAQVCDQVAVMYAGRIVEKAPAQELFKSPLHPYTQALLQSIPTLTAHEALKAIGGMPPAVGTIPSNACAFAPRCGQATEVCTQALPSWQSSPQQTAHQVRCVLPLSSFF
ncbi:MAG: ABC transporter ATP-binding protein [Vampirovibrionales bacterium]